jgi:hypothetical protein
MMRTACILRYQQEEKRRAKDNKGRAGSCQVKKETEDRAQREHGKLKVITLKKL